LRLPPGWRSILLVAVAFTTMAAIPTGAKPSPRPAEPKIEAAAPPNIVLVLTDDQRWDQLGQMPILRRTIGKPGTSFTNAVVVNPPCCPSRTTILTGRYSHDTGVWTNRAPDGGFTVFDDSSTVATWLAAAGYRTGFVGKYLNEYTGTYIPPGWDRWSAFTNAAGGGGGYYNYTLNTDGTLIDYGAASTDYSTDVLATQASRFVTIVRALAPLTPRQRAAVVLTYILGYTSDEAAELLGIRASTVRVLAGRGRAQLRETMGEADD
jgi:hypothetical protein